MRIWYMAALLSACLVGGGLVGESQAQHQLNPRSITQLKEAFPDTSRKWTYEIDRISKNRVRPLTCLTNHGLILVSRDHQSVQCIAEDNQVVWEEQAPPNTFIQFVTASVDGRYVYFFHYESETRGVSEVLSSDGQQLWIRPDVGYRFSLSGDYMISQWNPLDYVPVKVLDTRTGQPLWTHEVGFRTITDLGPDKLVYIAYDTLWVAELATGRKLWTQALRKLFPGDLNYADWSLATSEDGGRFVVMEHNAHSLSNHTILFSNEGRLLWKRDSAGIGQLVGMTPNGGFLSVITYDRNGSSLSLLNVDTGEVIWTVEGRIYNNGAVVLDDVVFLDQVNDTLIFTIDQAGQLENQERINRTLMFCGNRSRPNDLSPLNAQDRFVELLFVDIQEDHLSFSILDFCSRFCIKGTIFIRK